MAWPKYEQLSIHRFSLTHLKVFFTNRASLKAVKSFGLVIILIVVYLLGTHLSPPYVHVENLHQMLQKSTLLAAIDALFTGNGFSHLAPFALGVFPFLLFYRGPTKPVGNQLRNTLRISYKSSLAFLIFVIIIVIWLTLTGIVPASIISFGGTALYLVAGTIVLLYVDYWLTENNGPDILSINAVLIGLSYAQTLILAHRTLDLVIGALIILFIISFALLLQAGKPIALINIRKGKDATKGKVTKGELPMPATTDLLRSSLLLSTFFLLAVVTTILNIFINLSLSPFESSLPNVLLFITVMALIAFVFSTNELIDGLFSQFNSQAIARMLMTNYWIIPGRNVGQMTAKFLTQQALKRHRLSYNFYLIWAILFSLVGLFAQFAHLPITPLPFGPLGFIIILTFCAEIGNEQFQTIQFFIQKVNFGEFWSLPPSAAHNLQNMAEQYDIEEHVQNFLPKAATEEERAQISQILASFKKGDIRLTSIYTLINILRRINNRQLEQTVELVLFIFFRNLLACMILASLLTIVIVWLIQAGRILLHFDLSVKDLALVAIPLWVTTLLSCIFYFKIVQDIKTFIKHPGNVVLFPSTRKSQEEPEDVFDVDGEFAAYSFMITQQQEVINDDLRRVNLANITLHEYILHIIRLEVCNSVDACLPDPASITEERLKQLLTRLDTWVSIPEENQVTVMSAHSSSVIKDELGNLVIQHYEAQGREIEAQVNALNANSPTNKTKFSLRELESSYAQWDTEHLWKEYLDSLNAMRVHLFSRSYMKVSALAEFEKQADNKFAELQQNIQHAIVNDLLIYLRHKFILSMSPSSHELYWDRLEPEAST